MRIHPDAEQETKDAFDYYEERSFQAAENFLLELKAYRKHAVKHPLTGHPVHERYRRINLKRFPFAIIYRPDGESIFIIAIIHEKRHPDYWKHRIADDRE
jgi:plasmid stabilization system protein ParE